MYLPTELFSLRVPAKVRPLVILEFRIIFGVKICGLKSALSGPPLYILKYTYFLPAPVHFDWGSLHLIHFIYVFADVFGRGVVLSELFVQLDVVF